MTNKVTTRLIKIGISQGVRIPKILLEQVGFRDEVEIAVEDDRLVLRALSSRRHGWEAQFERMAANGDARLLDGDTFVFNKWEQEEWE